mmetsp:Transcript_18696/g.59355  ORF Transcript_18696/g.59355 Transcript_18696/m.59355 type:complete len:901 (-) Transcript_18696:77-2779(-)
MTMGCGLRRPLLLLRSCLALSVVGLARAENATVLDGAWRFTAVTGRLIRIEYDAQRQFVDEPTIAFLRSEPPRGAWREADTAGEWGHLQTDNVSVRYRRGLPPCHGSVTVSSKSKEHAWTWGDDPADGNLRGTARTLDSAAETLNLNCHEKVSPTMDNSEMHCTWGLVSKLGWAVVNDTGAPVRKGGWYAASRNSVDISVFLHGLDYTGALKDFFYAAGPPALPPRYALGSIFTRWYDFDSDSVMAMVEEFESRSMPLDAWIFDMNWHLYGPWGSYTWNEDNFPRLQDFLDWMQAKKLPIGANTHDHDGISPSEKTYDQVCAALACGGGGESSKPAIPFDLYNKTYTMAVENITVGAIDTKGGKQGIDFYWIDYQQGEHDRFQDTRIPKLNPTIVLNELRAGGPARRGENRRPLILSRWGGLGNHRYPLGFSGDQMHDWKGLRFLPYFTSTAANVAYNYWSHDTVGGDSKLAGDYELSVRWVQTSAWSPVLRIHDKGSGAGGCATRDTCGRVVPWDLPDAYYVAVREAMRCRDELVPYIYTAAFNTASTGLALVRPMYYENASEPELYGLDKQYLFGPDMVISPITSPSGPEAVGFEQALGAAAWSVYAPKSGGGWVDRLSGDFASGRKVTGAYGIFDVPGLLRQGAVLPLRPRAAGESSLARAGQPLRAVEFRVAPAEAFYTGGATTGEGTAVDDDGVTTDHLQGKYATVRCHYSFKGRTFFVIVSQDGDFPGRPAAVTLKLSFPQLPPLSIVRTTLKQPTITYDHRLLGSVVTFAGVELGAQQRVELAIDGAYPAAVLPNFVGALGRLRQARYAKDALDRANVNYGAKRLNLTAVALSATHMSPAFAAGMPQLWTAAKAQVAALLGSDETLRQDRRRSAFLSKILQLRASEAGAELVV